MWATGRYDAVGDRIAHIADLTVEEADRRVALRGKAVVDLACGTGSAALAAAARGAVVTGVDLTPELIAIGEQKASTAGRSVTWVTADAAATGLPDAAFDAVVSNMGIVFVAPDLQVPELARLVKPSGVLAFSSWVRDVSNPLFDPVVAVLGAPPTTGFSPDQWGDPAVVAERLGAQFDDIEVERSSLAWEFDSLEAACYFLTHESPIHLAIFEQLDAAQHERLLAAFQEALLAHATEHGIGFGASYAVVSAIRR